MKKSEYDNIFKADLADLKKQLEELKTKLADIEVRKITKPSKNTRESRNIRKKIAVLATVIREKELLGKN